MTVGERLPDIFEGVANEYLWLQIFAYPRTKTINFRTEILCDLSRYDRSSDVTAHQFISLASQAPAALRKGCFGTPISQVSSLFYTLLGVNHCKYGIRKVFFCLVIPSISSSIFLVRNGHIKRITDPDIQSSVLEIMGTNVSTTFIQCPADPKKTLGIKLPFLVMIIKNVSRISIEPSFYSSFIVSYENILLSR